jgi:DTW domain-containing protein YfiP
MKERVRGSLGAGYRVFCYGCYRPKSSCMCEHINAIDTKTKFVILMHSKEFRKTKNNTGLFSHRQLKNSELFIGIDFSKNEKITKIVEDENNNCYLLFPSKKAHVINDTDISKDGKTTVIFIIDSTWACAKKIMRVSENITNLPYISFSHSKTSAYKIKEQPSDICLSTIESIHTVLEILNDKKQESLKVCELDNFLNPFTKMVEYQLSKSPFHKR